MTLLNGFFDRLHSRFSNESGLNTSEKLVTTAVIFALALGVFLFIGNIVVNEQASETGQKIDSAELDPGTPSL